MGMTFIALGTMGWIPSERRESPCFALVRGRRLFVFDCGTGARRLGNPELAPLFRDIDEYYIFLTHYHLDHSVGIIYLPGLLAGKKVTIAGPGKSVYGHSAAASLERLTTSPLFAHPIRDFPMDLDIVDLDPGDNRFDGFTLTAVQQEHTDPSLGLRMENILTYVTDTVCTDSTIELARHAPFLVHECWMDDDDYQDALRREDARVLHEHSHVDGVARIAQQAQVHTLALCHLNPAYREGRLRRMEQSAKEIFPNTVLLRDMQQFTTEED